MRREVFVKQIQTLRNKRTAISKQPIPAKTVERSETGVIKLPSQEVSQIIPLSSRKTPIAKPKTTPKTSSTPKKGCGCGRKKA